MAKPRVMNESKADKFKRIAAYRTQRILNDLRLLGNCANKSIYSYEEAEVSKIFSTIEKETKRVRILFNKPRKTFEL